MEDCCDVESSSAVASPVEFSCPQDDARGKKVNPLTLRTLLKEEFKPLVRDEASYRFCASPDCRVVYFDETGWTAPKEHLAVRVGIKEKEDPIPVCYCYGYSREDIRREIRKTGTTTIPGKIRAEVKAGRCQCGVKNPSGSCCLGDVGRAVKEAQKEYGRKGSSPITGSVPAMNAPEALSKNWSGLLLGGALTGGFLSSACCLGPLLLALLGIGGAGVLLKFEAYRPFIVLATLTLLGAGFYLAYRKPKVAGVAGAPDLDGCGCEIPRANRTGRILLWLVTGAVGFFLAFPYLVQAFWG